MGLRANSDLAARFTDADAFGFVTNARTRISVLDIDTTDDRVLADAVDRHGPTPLVARTASGKFHAFYKSNGEFRKIRPFGDLPIDLLGVGGLVVAVPSRTDKGEYSFVEGSLDDVDLLPVMRGLEPGMYRPSRDTTADPVAPTACKVGLDGIENVFEGQRNNALWRFCMRQLVITNADIDAIVAAAIVRNSSFTPPLPENEAVAVAASAWGYTARGRNWVGQRGSYLPEAKARALVGDPYLTALIVWLQAENAPTATFWVSDGLAEGLGWPRRQFANARRQAVATGWIVPITAKAPGRPISYRWGNAAARTVVSPQDGWDGRRGKRR